MKGWCCANFSGHGTREIIAVKRSARNLLPVSNAFRNCAIEKVASACYVRMKQQADDD